MQREHPGEYILRSFCVVSFCKFCVRFTQTRVFVYLGDVHNTGRPLDIFGGSAV